MNVENLNRAVVDTNILIHSRGQFSVSNICIPPSIQSELRSDKSKLNHAALSIEVVEPDDRKTNQVKEASSDINSPTSDEDEAALALALDLNVPLITDDKALQNLALKLEAEFYSFNTEKVSEVRSWKLVCDNCGRDVSNSHCSYCGSDSFERKRV